MHIKVMNQCIQMGKNAVRREMGQNEDGVDVARVTVVVRETRTKTG